MPIVNITEYQNTLNKEIESLCRKAGAWNNETTTQYLVTAVDEYYAQLPTITVEIDGVSTEIVAPDAFDANDLSDVFHRAANQAAMRQRLEKKEWIPKNTRGNKSSILGGLV